MPTGLFGRLLALAILITLPALLYLGVAGPVLDFYRERQATLATDRLLEPRLRAAADEVPQLRARVAELRQTANTQKITFDGATDALASAGLQSLVEGLATSAGVVISSTDGLPGEVRGDYRRIGLRMSVSGAYDSIVKLLGAIETARPPLVFENLQIHGKPMVAGSLAIAQLDAGFSVYGFRGADGPALTKP